MNRDEFMYFFEDTTKKMLETAKKKNADYSGTAGGDEDPFFNLTRVEAIGVASTEQGVLIRMFDKFARITTFVQKGVLQVKDESIEDTLLDLANYSILMAGYISSKKAKAKKPFFTYVTEGARGTPENFKIRKSISDEFRIVYDQGEEFILKKEVHEPLREAFQAEIDAGVPFDDAWKNFMVGVKLKAGPSNEN